MSKASNLTSESTTYNVLRELGSRAQRSFAAMREPNELVILHKFARSTNVGIASEVTAETMAILLRDARCLSKHWHPNITRVRYVDVIGTELNVATEWIDGATLHELFEVARLRGATGTLLPLPILVRILLDALSGLYALHSLRDGINASLGTIHGEMSPHNIVVGKDGVARIVNVFRPRPVRIGAGSEALPYAAPEALDRDGTEDARSDLYAVAAILWEGLTGRQPYTEIEPSRILQRQRQEELPTPAIEGDDRFSGLAYLTMVGLAFDPALRFRNALDAANELRKLSNSAIATGAAVAQLVTETCGESIRARRAALDPANAKPRMNMDDTTAKLESLEADPPSVEPSLESLFDSVDEDSVETPRETLEASPLVIPKAAIVQPKEDVPIEDLPGPRMSSPVFPDAVLIEAAALTPTPPHAVIAERPTTPDASFQTYPSEGRAAWATSTSHLPIEPIEASPRESGRTSTPQAARPKRSGRLVAAVLGISAIAALAAFASIKSTNESQPAGRGRVKPIESARTPEPTPTEMPSAAPISTPPPSASTAEPKPKIEPTPSPPRSNATPPPAAPSPPQKAKKRTYEPQGI